MSFDLLNQEFDALVADGRSGPGNGSQIWLEDFRKWQVIEGRQGNISGAVKAEVGEGLKYPDGHQVIGN